MRKMIVIMLAVLLTASVASAGTSWIRPTVDGPGNWNDASNWDAGVPTTATDETLTGMDAANLAEIQVTTSEAIGGRLKHGNNSAAYDAPLIRIQSGGSLNWENSGSTPAYIGNLQNARMLIEDGGLYSYNKKLHIGYSAGVTGIVDVAGTFDMTATFGKIVLGYYGTGLLNVLDGGVVKVSDFRNLSYRGLEIGATSILNIEGTGKVIYAGNDLADAETQIAGGRIAGDGVLGNVIAVYDAGLDETSIIVNPTPAAQDLSPGDGDTVPLAFPLTLSWTIPSAYDGNDVYVDVWLGTDPNALTAEPNVPAAYMSPVLTNALNATSVGVDGSVEDTYYWRVDLNVGPDVNALSTVHTFTTATDLAPTVSIETPDTMTWSDEPVAIAATVTDDGVSTLTYGWTADPDGSGDPNLTVVFSPSADAEDPTVTITNTGSPVEVTLTLTATDSAGSDTASVILEVYKTACQMTLVGGLEERMPTDFNWDCTTNILDFLEIAAEWLNDYTSATGPVPVP